MNLDKNVIEVWHVETPEQLERDAENQIIKYLSADEKMKLAEFQMPAVKTEYLVTRALLRFCLSNFYRMPPNKFEFSKEPLSRPTLISMGLPHEIHFSISHTQGLISCAFSCFPEMGIDVENVQKRIEIIDLVTNVLSGEEFVQFNSTTSSQQKTLFFKLWTAKEAYLKAHGLGLIDNLSDISFNINLEKDQVDLVRGVSPREDTASWAFVMSTPTPQHQMTLAFKKRKSDPTQVIHHFAALPF